MAESARPSREPDEPEVAWLRGEITRLLTLATELAADGRGEWAVEVVSNIGYAVYTRVDITAHDAVVCTLRKDIACLVAAGDPGNTIARCEAELALLEEHGGEHMCFANGRDGNTWDWYIGDCRVMRHLASAYRHRTGYAEQWMGLEREEA